MRPLRSFIVAMATISLLALVVSSVSAASRRSFHLDKTCAADLTKPLGYVCTVQHSDFKWFPAGTKVHYVSQNSVGDVVQGSDRHREWQHKWHVRLERPGERRLHVPPWGMDA